MKKTKQTKVNIVAWSLLKRSLSLLLALTVLIQCGILASIHTQAATSAEFTGRLNLGEGVIEYQQHLKDNGDGSYSLTLELADASSVKEVSESETVSKNGYFTAPADGKYLVELWGGNGASGNASSYGSGGAGGAGGYVYGAVTLKKGETLFYQLGGNGQQTTSEDSGGGVNGDGGHAGASTTYVVGGGGGYSAVYLFGAGEFESKYLDDKGNMLVDFISEADRTSKFIMVAGGGGGGGAGSGNVLFRDNGNAPNGGIGGTVGISASGTLADGGTFFSGGNGMTSGTSTAYTGKGATDAPGDTMESVLGSIGVDWFTGLQPNDWVASYNAATPGGNGGAGNLRGGSGGAGYAGGSGGVQTEIIIPTNVGGGGGGSSYAAAIVDYNSVAPDQSDHDHTYGGAVHITAISDGASTLFRQLALTLTPSEYFQIGIDSELTPIEEGGEVIGYRTAEGWLISGDSAGGYTLSGLDVNSQTQKLTLTFTPKAGFAGGNAVPLLAGNSLTVSDASQDDTPTSALNLDSDCAKVNVPLNFQAVGKNLMTNTPGTEFDTNSLYEDNISGIDLSSWQYAFIDSISSYKVFNTDWTEVTADTVAPSTTTRYYVGYTVTPKAGAAALVGDAVTTTNIRAISIITMLSDGAGVLNGNTVQYNKLLTYDPASEQYFLSFQADISPVPLTEGQVSDKMTLITASAPSYEIKYSGYYFIQAWGGDGGKGGSVTDKNNSGGAGGKGGYYEGYVYLDANTSLTITVGQNGATADDETTNWLGSANPDPGGAGGNTSIYIGNEPLLVVGGGGGGGAAWRTMFTGRSAISGQSGYNCEVNMDSVYTSMGQLPADNLSNTVWYDNTIDSSVFVASGGGDKDNSTRDNNATGGSAGSTVKGTRFNSTTGHPVPTKFTTSTVAGSYSSSDYTNPDGGMVKITCLELTEAAVPATDMTNYVFQTELTEYFTINSVTCTDYNTGGALATGEITNANNQIVIPGINPTKSNNATSFAVQIAFVPKEGFAGGNDVPVLLKANTTGLNLESGMRLRQKDTSTEEDNYLDINVAGQEATDYANVVLNASAIGSITVGDAPGRTIDLEKDPIVGIAPSAMFTWTDRPDLSADDWRFDFVTTLQSLTKKGGTDELINSTGIVPDPLVTTLYTATVGIQPKVETAQKAVVVNSVAPVSKTQDIEIIVIPRIKYELTNVETSDKADLVNINGNFYYTLKAPDKDYYAKLSPAQGYQLPDPSIPGEENLFQVIANDGTTDLTSQVQYDPVTGIITVPAGLLIGTVTVRAEGVAKKYSITFYRQNALGEMPEKIDGGNYASGEPLSSMTVPAEPTPIEGYDFVWDWSDWDPSNPSTNDGQPTTMPNQSIVVIGTFVPEARTVTVHYVDSNGNAIAPDKVIDSYYMADVTEIAPAIDNYILTGESSKTLIGITENTEITFTYAKATGSMYIVYQYADGTQVSVTAPNQNPYTATISAGDTYSVASPTLTGYTPYILGADDSKTEASTVSGTITQFDVEKGKVIYVTYLPNTYTVTFDAMGGTVTPDAMTVEYDNVYNYNAASKTMDGLPTPIWPGHTFSCWYRDINGNGAYDPGEEVEGTDIVTGDATLIAHWTVNKGRVVLLLMDESGNSVYYTYVNAAGNEVSSSTKVYEGDIGSICQFEAPEVADYVAISNATGTRTYASSTQMVYVTYRYKVHTLTIHYQFQDGTLAANSHVETFREGDAPYTVTSPVYSPGPPEVNPQLKNYSPSMASYTNNCTATADITVTVYYTQEGQTEVVSVTVTWGELVFEYDYGTWNPETHQYSAPTIQPQVNDENTVTVTSNSETNIPVYVELSYSSDAAYGDLTGYYTETNNRYASPVTDYALLPQQYKKCYFWLDGFLPPGQTGQPQVGTCTVTISSEES